MAQASTPRAAAARPVGRQQDESPALAARAHDVTVCRALDGGCASVATDGVARAHLRCCARVTQMMSQSSVTARHAHAPRRRARSRWSRPPPLVSSPASARRTNGTISNFAGTPGAVRLRRRRRARGQALMSNPGDVAFLADGSPDRSPTRTTTASGASPRAAPSLTAAGGGSCGGPPCGDGGPADDAELDHPRGVTALPDGGYLIADTGDDRIRRVFPDGHIATVAGTTAGFGGDGGPATQAKLNHAQRHRAAARRQLPHRRHRQPPHPPRRASTARISTVAGTTPGLRRRRRPGHPGPARLAPRRRHA